MVTGQLSYHTVPGRLLEQDLPGPEVIKLFPCLTQMNTKFILLINVKMPTIVGILTFISMINTTSERLKARNFFICPYFSFYKQLKFLAQLSRAQKQFYNLGARVFVVCQQGHHQPTRVLMVVPWLPDFFSLLDDTCPI